MIANLKLYGAIAALLVLIGAGAVAHHRIYSSGFDAGKHQGYADGQREGYAAGQKEVRDEDAAVLAKSQADAAAQKLKDDQAAKETNDALRDQLEAARTALTRPAPVVRVCSNSAAAPGAGSMPAAASGAGTGERATAAGGNGAGLHPGSGADGIDIGPGLQFVGAACEVLGDLQRANVTWQRGRGLAPVPAGAQQ